MPIIDEYKANQVSKGFKSNTGFDSMKKIFSPETNDKENDPNENMKKLEEKKLAIKRLFDSKIY